jgi:hypothetical protein
MAMGRMAQYLPARYAQLEDLESYFVAVGAEVLREINEAMAAWERTQTQPIELPGRLRARVVASLT